MSNLYVYCIWYLILCRGIVRLSPVLVIIRIVPCMITDNAIYISFFGFHFGLRGFWSVEKYNSDSHHFSFWRLSTFFNVRLWASKPHLVHLFDNFYSVTHIMFYFNFFIIKSGVKVLTCCMWWVCINWREFGFVNFIYCVLFVVNTDKRFV